MKLNFVLARGRGARKISKLKKRVGRAEKGQLTILIALSCPFAS
jgi:hypothetical protein